MLIVCPACVSSYKVEPAAMAEAGAVLRCAHCRRPLAVATPAGVPPLGASGPATRAPDAAHDGSALRGMAAAVLLLATMSGALFWRDPIARAVPGAAGLYRLAGLPEGGGTPTVSDLRTVLTPDGLEVAGTLANPHRTRVALPRLHLTLRDGADDALASWSAPPPKASLAPGETVAFTSHLDKPPAQAHDLAVSFAADRVAVSDGAARDAR